MQQPVYGAQIYPMPSDAVNTTAKIQYGSRVEDSYYEPKRQLLGYSVFVVVATVAALLCLGCTMAAFRQNDEDKGVLALKAISCGLMLYFKAVSLHYPEYLGGKPSPIKSWPMLLSYFFYASALIFTEPGSVLSITCFFVALALAHYFLMFRDDSSDSFLLNFKPWVYKKKLVDAPVAQPYGQAKNLPDPYIPAGYPTPPTFTEKK